MVVRQFVFSIICLALCLTGCSSKPHDERLHIAVAANFSETAEELGEAFYEETGVKPVFSFASSGTLYAQIQHGAPFDVFLSADAARPDMCISNGDCVAGSDFVYAIGQLVLYPAENEDALHGPFNRLAIANPKTAPYGQAAMETVKALGLAESMRDRIIQGESVTQTYQFVETGAADLGFVALSQLEADQQYWPVPQEYYTPLKQKAVLTSFGAEDEAARAFLEFLKTPEARHIISSHGYEIEK